LWLEEFSTLGWQVFSFIKQQLLNTDKQPTDCWLIEEDQFNKKI